MGPVVGGWKLADMVACNLPENVATGFSKCLQGMVGAKYVPVLYVGEQIVHGVNYMIICKQTLVTPNAPEHLVELVLNNSPSGDWSIVSVQQIV